MAKLVLKLQFHSDIRRLSLEKDEISFESVKKLSAQLFPSLQFSSIHFKYLDDESDVITVTTEKEFEEAVNLAKNGIVKLTIVASSAQRRENAPPACGPRHPAYCDGCQQDSKEGIRGTRYKC